MDRTTRAAILAMIIVAGTVGGLGAFLGFGFANSVVPGLVLGTLAGLLIWGAARRAETFHPTDDNAHLADHSDRLHQTDAAPDDVTDPAAERPDDQTPGA